MFFGIDKFGSQKKKNKYRVNTGTVQRRYKVQVEYIVNTSTKFLVHGKYMCCFLLGSSADTETGAVGTLTSRITSGSVSPFTQPCRSTVHFHQPRKCVHSFH